MHLFRLYRFFTTHLVRKPLVVANSKPRLAADRSVCLEYCVQMLYVWFCYLVRCMLNDIVDTTEMIDGLHDVIHRRALCRDAKRVGLEDKTRLFLCQTATLYVIRIISQVNLSAVIYAPLSTRHSFLHANGSAEEKFF